MARRGWTATGRAIARLVYCASAGSHLAWNAIRTRRGVIRMRTRLAALIVVAVIVAAVPAALPPASPAVSAARSCGTVHGAGFGWKVKVKRGKVRCKKARHVLRKFVRGG